MAHLGRTELELVRLATAALQREPTCQREEVVTLDRIEGAEDGPNWKIGLTVPGTAAGLDRAKIAVSRMLGREFVLLPTPND